MNKFVLRGALALALMAPAAAIAQPADNAAAEAAAVKKGYALYDNAGKKLGRVEQVRQSDGYVTFIYNTKIYRVPLASISVDGHAAKTTLSWDEIKG
ncbi:MULTISPECIES: hypothetical protein [Sphingomonadales]|uniref:PRC-barrel domain-containing protein n=1 Tax=Edaphosphingomonas haloaromaticamans TaxID=653954 RepID=A0A1S1HG12_9SPHN|nr:MULTISPECIES: hypothetical protein [Sphingomonas]AGH48795.1 hypothetical protein G432_05340 [Sphingomonas sp. MM-1]MDX3884184.1 hypothetical protein [Sphingomonas sp.]OHT21219.1 hypothetical protein BHE75_03225 [Sphingomonas haloaromaticamans]